MSTSAIRKGAPAKSVFISLDSLCVLRGFLAQIYLDYKFSRLISG